MKYKKVKELEDRFLKVYPAGFESFEMRERMKRHNMTKTVEKVRMSCSKESFKTGLNIYPELVKVVTRSHSLSVFEKMAFRDVSKEMDVSEKHVFIDAVYDLIHGDEERGFDTLSSLLAPYRLAKWTIITVFRAYYYPDTDVLMKPMTVKKVIAYFELDDLHYQPRANYDLYEKYRRCFMEIKDSVEEESLKPQNIFFSAFLKMTIQ